MSLAKVYVLKNNEWLCLNELFNATFTNARPATPNVVNNYVNMAGTQGRRFTGSRFDLTTIAYQVWIPTGTMCDMTLVLTELKQLIFTDDAYYIKTSREPGKRVKVRPGQLSVTKLGVSGMHLNLSFDVFESCSESIETTLNAVDLDYDWQFGMGLVAEDFSYIHESHSFDIWNFGDLTVDPREHDLIIRIEGVSEGNVTLVNQTTGDRFVYHPPLNSIRGEILSIDGVYPKVNGRHCGIDTNGELIRLLPGCNQIRVSGISRVKVSFEFRFRYV